MNESKDTSSVPKHALLVNPLCGRGLSPTEINQLHDFCRTQLDDVALFAPTHSSGMRQIAESLSDAGCKSFIISGGDGTVNLIAERLLTAGNAQTSICLLDDKGGSDLSRSIWAGVPNQERLACLKEENTQLIDTLLIEDSYGKSFVALNGCSIGVSAIIAKAKDEIPLNWPGWAKCAVPTLRSILRIQPIHTQNDGDAIAIVFSNGKFAGRGMQFAPEANLSDGKFEVTTIRPGNLFNYISNAPRLFSSGLVKNKLVEKTICGSTSVTCKNNVFWERDGEVGETTSLTVRCNPKSLRLVVPRG